ncbi:MAG: MCE family protein [Chlorobi bacterium]|nr:MCE family protein [Chlorobiota bacterium]
MRNERKSEIKVGLTVLIGLVVLLWVLGWAKNFSFDSKEKNVSVQFESVAGLSVGDQVSIRGIKKGYVDDIYIVDNTARVNLVLSEDTDLREDAKFSLMVLDLMGGKKIEIDPGKSSTPLDYKKIQKGYFLGDISTTMAMLGSVQDDLVDVIIEVKSSLNSLNKLLGNSEFTNDLQQSVISLNKLIAKTDKLISDNNESINNLLNNSNELVKNSNQFIVDNKDDITNTIQNINGLMNSTDSLVTQLSKFMNDVDKGENNIGKLVNDEQIMKDLQETLTQLKELSRIVLEQLKGEGFKVDADIF